MARSLLVVPASPWAGLASTCLGLVRALDRRGVRVAFVKPVAQPRENGAADRSAALVAAVSSLRPPDPVPAAVVERELSDGGLDAVLEKVVAAWQPVYGQSDVVVIEAVSPGPARLYAAGFNQALAQALDADVVPVGRWPPVAGLGPSAAGEPADAECSADGQSAASARAFGIEPRVAMISFSTGTSGAGSDVDKVAEATRLVAERAPGLPVDGPLQYDAAAIASVGQAKRPGSTVAGRASVFIFPDLDTGNTTYKAVQRSAHVVSIGPMLQGLAKPVNDLSRGALVDDIIYTIALTAVQARAS